MIRQCSRCLLIAAIGNLVLAVHGYFLAMTTESQVHVLNEGESVVLECNFHADNYNLFDFPVLWRKFQRGEETQMNIMGNMNEPFAASNRFEAAFTSLAPRYKFELSVLDVTQLDSGNYTCEIRGPYSTILGQSTHHLFVRAPVHSVTIVESESGQHGSNVIRLVENRATRLRCTAIGGSPPPSLEISIGKRDATADFIYRSSVALSGRRSMRLITYRTERLSHNFRAKAEDDGAKLKCVATVPGLKEVVEYVKMEVAYSPKLNCASKFANLDDRGVALTCEVSSNPQISSLAWIVDANGTTVSERYFNDKYWSTMTERGDGIVEAVLHFRHVKIETFRKYTVVAENSIGVTTTGVDIHRDLRRVHNAPLADAAMSHVTNRTTSRDTSRQTYIKQIDQISSAKSAKSSGAPSLRDTTFWHRRTNIGHQIDNFGHTVYLWHSTILWHSDSFLPRKTSLHSTSLRHRTVVRNGLFNRCEETCWRTCELLIRSVVTSLELIFSPLLHPIIFLPILFLSAFNSCHTLDSFYLPTS